MSIDVNLILTVHTLQRKAVLIRPLSVAALPAEGNIMRFEGAGIDECLSCRVTSVAWTISQGFKESMIEVQLLGVEQPTSNKTNLIAEMIKDGWAEETMIEQARKLDRMIRDINSQLIGQLLRLRLKKDETSEINITWPVESTKEEMDRLYQSLIDSISKCRPAYATYADKVAGGAVVRVKRMSERGVT